MLSHGVELLGKTRLLVCSRVLLVYALAYRAVDERAYFGEHLRSLSLVARIYRSQQLFDGSLNFGLYHLVPGGLLFDN